MDMKAPLEVLPSNHLVNWGQGRMLDLPKLRRVSSRESGVKKINSGSSDASTRLRFCSDQPRHLVFWSLYRAISRSISFCPHYLCGFLPSSFLLISEMFFVLAWEKKKCYVHYKEWFEKNISKQEMQCIACHTCSVTVFSPGSIRTITWPRITNQRLQEKSEAPTRPSSLVAELKRAHLQGEQRNRLWTWPLRCVVSLAQIVHDKSSNAPGDI